MRPRHNVDHHARLGKAGLRRRAAAAGAALGGFLVFGLAPMATAPSAQADLFDFDWLSDLFGSTVAATSSALDPSDAVANGSDVAASLDPSIGADLPGAAAAVPALLDHGDTGTVTAPALAAVDTTPPLATVGIDSTNSVPLHMTATTEPVVTISVGDGKDIPVVLDTGSNGLVVPWWDIALKDLTWPTHLGFGAYSGGMGYLYGVMPETVSFVGGDGITTTEAVPVDVVLFSWPTQLDTLFTAWWLPSFLGPANADGVLGIAPDAVGPNAVGTETVIQALPDGLNQGVLIDEPGNQLVFGPNPLTGGTTVDGVANSNLQVSIAGLAKTQVNAIIDSGGVFGTMPSSVPGAGSIGQGTEISVYNQDGEPLYSYTVGATPVGLNSPTVISSNGMMNTGYAPFSLNPVYIGYGVGGPTTTFYGN
ncbi:MAG TPA: PecA family PE domain-processing aspartic protease [Mycobacterium sp.]|nr:PecA family PE domain-processing aspartic protease [Mycobacterium sp.]